MKIENKLIGLHTADTEMHEILQTLKRDCSLKNSYKEKKIKFYLSCLFL